MFQRQESSSREQVTGCHPGTKLNRPVYNPQARVQGPGRSAIKPNLGTGSFSPSGAPPHTQPSFVPSLIHPGPKHPHTCYLPYFQAQEGPFPFWKNSLHSFLRSMVFPFRNSYCQREPDTPNSPRSELQTINPLTHQPSQLLCDSEHLLES